MSTNESVETAARGKWLIHLEQQIAKFLLQNKITAILLVVLAMSSASLVAQEQGVQTQTNSNRGKWPGSCSTL